MAVPIKTQPTFEAGQAIPLFSIRSNYYAAAADGQRFIVNVPVRDSTPFTLVQNWAAALSKK